MPASDAMERCGRIAPAVIRVASPNNGPLPRIKSVSAFCLLTPFFLAVLATTSSKTSRNGLASATPVSAPIQTDAWNWAGLIFSLSAISTSNSSKYLYCVPEGDFLFLLSPVMAEKLWVSMVIGCWLPLRSSAKLEVFGLSSDRKLRPPSRSFNKASCVRCAR
jgi:hypothetical protein